MASTNFFQEKELPYLLKYIREKYKKIEKDTRLKA